MFAAVVLYTLVFEAGRYWLPACIDAWRDNTRMIRES